MNWFDLKWFDGKKQLPTEFEEDDQFLVFNLRGNYYKIMAFWRDEYENGSQEGFFCLIPGSANVAPSDIFWAKLPTRGN